MIFTERLILRPFVHGDEYDVFDLLSDDYICKMTGLRPCKTVKDAKKFMEFWRYGAYAITERGDDEVIGIVQVNCRPWARCACLGYCLAEDYRGEGYMTEAVEAVKEKLFGFGWCDKIVLDVYEDNPASRKVAVKCGFHLDYDGYKENIYSDYGRCVSEESFEMTRGEYEWECRGEDFYTTAERKSAA